MSSRQGRAVRATAFVAVAVASGACGLALTGTTSDADAGRDAGASEAAADRATPLEFAEATDDAAADAGPCTPLPPDSGVVGALDLSTFIVRGNAIYNENGDRMMTLTNSNSFERGAAWDPNPVSVFWSYDLQFELRVGPGNPPGDGIAYALLQANAAPDVGQGGDGMGLLGLTNTGYAVVVDTFRNPTDPTDDDVTTLKLVTMPGFKVVAHAGLSELLNDGLVHAVDVSLSGPATLAATLHGPTKNVSLTASSTGFAQTAPAFIGFTAATGGSTSHNEVASITVKNACR